MTSRQGDATIIITPEMIECGANIIENWKGIDYFSLARDVYTAMYKIRAASLESSSDKSD